MIIVNMLGYIFVFICAYLFIVIFLPVLNVEPQPMTKRTGGSNYQIPNNREDVSFSVGSLHISAWLYKPETELEKYPCIVLSHGFGGTKDAVLESYANVFTRAGYAALTYDYRYYGDSDGIPRQLFCGKYQLEDLRAAVDFVSARPDIDADKIILWGTSAGAAYGINIAGQNTKIAGVIAQCGAFDHKEDSKSYIEREGYGFFLKLFVHGQRDKGRSRFGLSPHKFAAYGKPGTIAMITAPGAFEEISELLGSSKTFVNETCARLSLLPHAPDPIKSAEKVKCPVLFLTCGEDNLVSPTSHYRIVKVLGDYAEVVEYPIGHFDIYKGIHFDNATRAMVEFMDEKLGVTDQKI